MLALEKEELKVEPSRMMRMMSFIYFSMYLLSFIEVAMLAMCVFAEKTAVSGQLDPELNDLLIQT